MVFPYTLSVSQKGNGSVFKLFHVFIGENLSNHFSKMGAGEKINNRTNKWLSQGPDSPQEGRDVGQQHTVPVLPTYDVPTWHCPLASILGEAISPTR